MGVPFVVVEMLVVLVGVVRAIRGDQPKLRLTALLQSAIAVLLFLLLKEVIDIERQMPWQQEICGSSYNPCEVRVRNSY